MGDAVFLFRNGSSLLNSSHYEFDNNLVQTKVKVYPYEVSVRNLTRLFFFRLVVISNNHVNCLVPEAKSCKDCLILLLGFIHSLSHVLLAYLTVVFVL